MEQMNNAMNPRPNFFRFEWVNCIDLICVENGRLASKCTMSPSMFQEAKKSIFIEWNAQASFLKNPLSQDGTMYQSGLPIPCKSTK